MQTATQKPSVSEKTVDFWDLPEASDELFARLQQSSRDIAKGRIISASDEHKQDLKKRILDRLKK